MSNSYIHIFKIKVTLKSYCFWSFFEYNLWVELTRSTLKSIVDVCQWKWNLFLHSIAKGHQNQRIKPHKEWSLSPWFFQLTNAKIIFTQNFLFVASLVLFVSPHVEFDMNNFTLSCRGIRKARNVFCLFMSSAWAFHYHCHNNSLLS